MLASLGVILLTSGVGGTRSSFVDQESSSSNTFQAWASTEWAQTTKEDFEAGVLSQVDTSSIPGDVKLAVQVGNLTFSAGKKTRSAVIDTANGYAYFGTDDDPGKVVKIRLSDFTEVGDLTFTTGKKTRSAVIDTANGYAYFGTDDDPGKVVKIRLSDFTEVGNLTFSAGGKTRSAVIDTANGYAYFGTDDSPGKVVKIRLSDFTEVGELTFSAGGKTRSAVIDTTNGYAYFGTDDDPGKVVKIKLEVQYYSSGSIASQVLDTGVTGARLDALFWDETLQSGTDITFEVRASDNLFAKDAEPDPPSVPDWISVGGTPPVTSGLPSGRYMQWRATLTTSDTSKTPTLHEVRVYHY